MLAMSLEEPSIKDVHRFNGGKQDGVPIGQLKEWGPPDAIISENRVLFIKTLRIAPLLHNFDMLNDVSWWPTVLI